MKSLLAGWRDELAACKGRWKRLSAETNISYAIWILIGCLVFVFVWHWALPDLFQEQRVEFWGLIFDIIFILVIFSFFDRRRQRLQQIQSQHDIIDDYKAWDSEESRFRLAGAIRRLNRMGEHAVNLAGARISDFSFASNGLGNLQGSTFYDGSWGQRVGDGSVMLTKVEFDRVDCRSVTFSPFDPLAGLLPVSDRRAKFIDCSFVDTDLRGAKFNGALLQWTESPPNSHFVYEKDHENGDFIQTRVSQGPFYRAKLGGTSFSGCYFGNVDFRDASGLLQADFSEAKGLEQAKFDSQETKDAVLANAARKAAKAAG